MQDWRSMIHRHPQYLSTLCCAQILSLDVRNGVFRDLPCCLSSTHVLHGLAAVPVPVVLVSSQSRSALTYGWRSIMQGNPQQFSGRRLSTCARCSAFMGLAPRLRWWMGVAGFEQRNATPIPVPLHSSQSRSALMQGWRSIMQGSPQQSCSKSVSAASGQKSGLDLAWRINGKHSSRGAAAVRCGIRGLAIWRFAIRAQPHGIFSPVKQPTLHAYTASADRCLQYLRLCITCCQKSI